MHKIFEDLNPAKEYELLDLFNAAIRAAKTAYAPYSKFKVGASLKAEKEDNDNARSTVIFNGGNIENASYPAGICAERLAVFKAVHAGYSDLKEMAVYCEGSPCGICRQVLQEFNPEGDMLIYLLDPRDFKTELIELSEEFTSKIKVFTLKELFPEPFVADNLSSDS